MAMLRFKVIFNIIYNYIEFLKKHSLFYTSSFSQRFAIYKNTRKMSNVFNSLAEGLLPLLSATVSTPQRKVSDFYLPRGDAYYLPLSQKYDLIYTYDVS